MARPDRSREPGAPEREPAPRSRWVSVAVIALVTVLLGLIVVLHLSGLLGPGIH
jgi:hypothetical protein